MSQIFVNITVDAITLAETKPGGSSGSPISLGSYSSSDVYISMMAQGSAVVNNQDKSELTIQAAVGDQIVYTITAPGDGQNYFPVLYDDSLSNTNVKSYGPNTAEWTNYCLQSGGSGTAPVFANTIPDGYPNEGSPNTNICPQWLFQVNGAGSTQYTMSFAIVNTQTGAVVGYYKWDPFININN